MKLDIISSFVNGLEKYNSEQINNAVFIAKELFGMDLDYEFRDHGDLGVVNYSLCENLLGLSGYVSDKKAFDIGRRLSEYKSEELRYMAKHLFNKTSGLFPEERKIAREILKELT